MKRTIEWTVPIEQAEQFSQELALALRRLFYLDWQRRARGDTKVYIRRYSYDESVKAWEKLADVGRLKDLSYLQDLYRSETIKMFSRNASYESEPGDKSTRYKLPKKTYELVAYPNIRGPLGRRLAYIRETTYEHRPVEAGTGDSQYPLAAVPVSTWDIYKKQEAHSVLRNAIEKLNNNLGG
jgi:hypothetical protein